MSYYFYSNIIHHIRTTKFKTLKDKNKTMKKILYSILLFAHISFAQVIENDAQDLLDIYLNYGNLSLKEYATNHGFKSLYVLTSNLGAYSKVDFDSKGNIISYIYMIGSPIRKIETEYDENNRVTKVKNFDEQEKLTKEIYTIYKNDSILTYSSIDHSLLELQFKSKTMDLDEMYEGGKMIVALKKEFDENGNLISETWVQDQNIKKKLYEFNENEQYVTAIEMDLKGNIISSHRYLIEKKNKISNQTEFYNEKSELPYKIETFDKNELISELYFDLNGNRYKEIKYKIDGNGLLSKMELINYATNNNTQYSFKTNNKGWLMSISQNKKVIYNYTFLLNE